MELRPADLLKEFKAGKFRAVYYFIGEEAAAKAEALAALKIAFKADDFNFREFAGDPGAEAPAIVSEAMTLPAFAERRLVIVKNPKIPAEARATLAEYLKEALASTTLVLFSDERKADPRDALVRAASTAGAVCVFSPLREDEAAARLKAEAKKAGKELSDEAAARLVAEAGTDWGVLSQELEKALLFAKSAQRIAPEDVLECLGYQKAADPFALPRLIQDRRLKESLSHLRRLFKDGKPDEQAFKALAQISSAVSKQFKAKRLVKARTAPDEIFRALRLNSYYDRDYLAKLGKLSEKRLVRDMKLCLEAETSLKSKAWLDPKLELETLVAGLCRPDQDLAAAGAAAAS